MEPREGAQGLEAPAGPSRVEGGTGGSGGEVAEAERRQSSLLRRKVELQHRIQQLRDEESMLQHEKAVRSFAKAKEEKLATAAEQRQGGKQHSGRKASERRPPEQKKSLPGAETPNAGATITDKGSCDTRTSKAGQSTSGASVQPLPSHRPRGSAQTRREHSRTSFVLAGAAAAEGVEKGSGRPSMVPVPPRPRRPSADTEEEGSSVQEEGLVLGLDFSRIIHSSQMHVFGGEMQAEAKRRARREKMQATENRHQRSLRRLNLVEEMFSKALERRMRAMERIAADPPADRLVGNHAVQHIPVSALSGQLRQTALALMAGDMEEVPIPARAPSPTGAGRDALGRRVFLTAVDAAAAEKQAKAPTDAPDAEDALQATGEETDPSAGVNGVDEEELLREWQELGYTAVYLPATRRLVYPGAHDFHKRNSKKPYSPNAWMQMHMPPLPPLHLVQRQIPPEVILSHSQANSVGRRRPLPFICIPRKK
ncbi:uncharacterized protein Tco025E_03713 [Trypanosoma conorhini]|uniref:Uncharacterized protein n=1 Tax=Trypanosoma conorhini TaxID=83891 RepID=A0A3R7L3W8_9TRYP|nr:uncharacterized protein Tco025E_03713 [Trypanosoma conorhini]RNF20586.1 hypothetical protein Tco025E_03713 [Trypanosoma conorhini]